MGVSLWSCGGGGSSGTTLVSLWQGELSAGPRCPLAKEEAVALQLKNPVLFLLA